MIRRIFGLARHYSRFAERKDPADPNSPFLRPQWNPLRRDLADQYIALAGRWLTTLPAPAMNAEQKRYIPVIQALIETISADYVQMDSLRLKGKFSHRDGAEANYWLERLDPLHRVGYRLTEQWKRWAKTDTVMSFWAWTNTRLPQTAAARPDGDYGRVEYLAAEYRLRYLVKFVHQRLIRIGDGMELDTNVLSTAFSGSGFGIFVYSPDDELYVHSHEVAFFHHSSFLGGHEVLAAGEMVVTNGALKVITAKSGHYRPDVGAMHRLAWRLRPYAPSDTIIRPDLRDSAGGEYRYYNLRDFEARQRGARVLDWDEVKRNLPRQILHSRRAIESNFELVPGYSPV